MQEINTNRSAPHAEASFPILPLEATVPVRNPKGGKKGGAKRGGYKGGSKKSGSKKGGAKKK